MRQVRQSQGLKQVDAAARLEISPPYLSEMEAGKKAPPVEVLEAMCSWQGFSLEWLLFGEDEEAGERARVREAAELVIDCYENGRLMNGQLKGAIARVMEYYVRTCKGVRVPVRSYVAADSQSRVAFEALETEWVELGEDAVAYRVRGDSMRPVAWDGQVVVFGREAVEDGDLGLVLLRDGRAYFKRVWLFDDHLSLESANPAYPERPVEVRHRDVRETMRYRATIA